MSLPFSTETAAGPSVAGTGNALVNNAVAQECNNGYPLTEPQWYTLPAGDVGLVYVRGQALYLYGAARNPERLTSNLAVVDYASGEVLACNGGPVNVTAAHSTAIVMYVDATELAECRADLSCAVDFQMFATKTSGPPPNDNVENALLISSAPFSGTADTSLATADGPNVLANCRESEIEPTQANSVWWRYTPTVSGALPISLDIATFGAPAFEKVVDARVGLARMTAQGPVKVARPLDEFGCETEDPFVVEAGTTYLIAVYTRYDAYYDRPLNTGGQVTLQVGAQVPPTTPAPSPVITDETASTAVEVPVVVPPATTVAEPVVTSSPIVSPPTVRTPPVRFIPRPALNRTIRITKVQYNAPRRDTKANRNGEYLRLKNTGTQAVTLTGWTVRDGAGATYRFKTTRLAAGGTLTLFTGRGSATSTKRYWGRKGHVWNNKGKESATLRDNLGRTVRSCAWTSRARGYHVC